MGEPVIRGSRLSLLSLANCRFQFHKRSQLFIRVNNEMLSVVAMRIGNPERSPAGINRGDTASAPTGFAEIIRDDFPVL